MYSMSRAVVWFVCSLVPQRHSPPPSPADDLASPESALGVGDDNDDYTWTDTDGVGDDDDMHVAVGQPAGPRRGRATEEVFV